MASGCGSAHHPSPATRSGATPAASPAGTGRYINAVTRLHTTVANASSTFFHTPHAQLHVQAEALRRAYAAAAAELRALPTPAAASVPARSLLAAWQRGADGLAVVLAHRPFDPGRAWSTAVQSEQTSDQTFGTVLAIP
jgi:hypothetical protein